MKRALVLVVMAAFLVSAGSVFADYNHELTQKTMQSNAASLGKARTAAGTSDFAGAAEGLIQIARNASMLSAMDPPKGSKADWAAAQTALANAAAKAIVACVARDKAALDAAIVEVIAARDGGHKGFRG